MKIAVRLAEESLERGGGPFGAVIVKNGEIVAQSANNVIPKCDPTAHAEVEAIRAATQKIGSPNLSGCEIYASCEPCPMCLGAIYWARLDALYYANTKKDAEDAGFDDSFIYDELAKDAPLRRLKTSRMTVDGQLKAFTIWNENEDKIRY